MDSPKVGKVDWLVFDQLPAVRDIQFFGDAMTGVGRLLTPDPQMSKHR
jgi:hypothetical protein